MTTTYIIDPARTQEDQEHFAAVVPPPGAVTKFTFGMQSVRIPNCFTPMHVPDLDKHLKRDLNGHRIKKVDGLVQWAFPVHDKLGFPINQQFAEKFKNKFLDDRLRLFTHKFKNENTGARYLNTIILYVYAYIKNLPNVENRKPKRFWTANYHNTLLPNDTLYCKPDMALVDLVDGKLIHPGAIRWHHIYSVAEATTTPRYTARMKNTITTKSYFMLCHQGDRNFSPCISIHGGKFNLVITDRQGEVRSQERSFDSISGVVEFLQILIILVFCDGPHVGLDRNMERQKIPPENLSPYYFDPDRNKQPYADNEFEFDSDFVPKIHPYPYSRFAQEDPVTCQMIKGLTDIPAHMDISFYEQDLAPGYSGAECDIAFITVESVKYTVIKEIFRSQGLVGRGTRVWLVLWPDQESLVIIKQSWILLARQFEAEFLKNLTVENIPICLASSIYETSTERIRLYAGDQKGEAFHREKRVIVMGPAGSPLSSFTNLVEFVGAFLDVLRAIQKLEAQGVAHRDISYNNILLQEVGKRGQKLWPDTTPEEACDRIRQHFKCRKGLLIDFDYAGFLEYVIRTTQAEEAEEEAGRIEDAGDVDVDVDSDNDDDDSNNDDDDNNDDDNNDNDDDERNSDSQSRGVASNVSSHQSLYYAASTHSTTTVLSTFSTSTSISNQTTSDATLPISNTRSRRLREKGESGTRTGTAPFMALEMLLCAPLHKVRHDVESVAWVLLFACTYLRGPSRIRVDGVFAPGVGTLEIKKWFKAINFNELYTIKSGQLLMRDRMLVQSISEYFRPLENYIRELFAKMFPGAQRPNPQTLTNDQAREMLDAAEMHGIQSHLTCDEFIEILERALQDNEVKTWDAKFVDSQPEKQPGNSNKRSLPASSSQMTKLDSQQISTQAVEKWLGGNIPPPGQKRSKPTPSSTSKPSSSKPTAPSSSKPTAPSSSKKPSQRSKGKQRA